MNYTNLKLLQKHEGYCGMPYRDGRGYLTIGYGTLLPLSEEEAQLLLQYRLKKAEKSLEKIEFYYKLPIEIREVLQNMCYNLGITGLLKFKKTLFYLEHRMFKEASSEMLNSKWANQVGERAFQLSTIVESYEGF